MGLEDRQPEVVVALLRPGERQPEQREMSKEPHLLQRLFPRLRWDGPVQACYAAGVSGYGLNRLRAGCDVAVR